MDAEHNDEAAIVDDEVVDAERNDEAKVIDDDKDEVVFFKYIRDSVNQIWDIRRSPKRRKLVGSTIVTPEKTCDDSKNSEADVTSLNDDDSVNPDECQPKVVFEPTIGMRVQKIFDGAFFYGTVMKDAEPTDHEGEQVLMWHVVYDDGDAEDMDREELFQCRIPSTVAAAAVSPTTRTSSRHKERPRRLLADEDSNMDNSEVKDAKHNGDEGDRKPAAVSADPRAHRQEEDGNVLKESVLDRSAKQYEEARRSICLMPGMRVEEVAEALEKVGPPYGLQTVMNTIQQSRNSTDWTEPMTGRFLPEVGTCIRKMFNGRNFHGVITKEAEPVSISDDMRSKKVLMWEVTYEDGEKDDMDWNELFQCRADRPVRLAPCRGRQLHCLEIFCGWGIVTQEFCERKWRVASIDCAEWSNATIKKDILSFKPEEDLQFVPDFIWASPPCETYSNLAGGYHRNASEGRFEITSTARAHNLFFQRMTEIMRWAKERHPHLIVVIENPVGQMKMMPLMKEFTKTFGLHCTTVHYCAFGRDDKKPTMLWTNDFELKATLGEFTCDSICPYSKGQHPLSVRGQGNRFDASAIPQPLAEEVAECVNAKFYQNRIRYIPAGDP